MYDVYIYNPQTPEYKLKIHNTEVTNNSNTKKIMNANIIEGINTIDSFSFSIFPNNPYYSEIKVKLTNVMISNKKTGKIVFEGRVVKDKFTKDATGNYYKTIECENILGYLQDSLTDFLPVQYWNIVNDSYNPDGSIYRKGALKYIINKHNEKMKDYPYKQIHIGEITKTCEDDDLYFGMQQTDSCWTAIKEKLLDLIGGEIALRKENEKWYLDYADEFGTTKNTTIKSRRNLKTISKENDPSSYITRLYPLGGKLTKESVDENGNPVTVETDERLTIDKANNGITYIDDEEGIRMYGVNEGYKIWEHVVRPQTLLLHGKTYMAKNNKIKQKFTIDCLNLNLIGLDFDEFEVHNYYPLQDDESESNSVVRVIKKTTNLNNPETSTLELGDKLLSASEMQIKREVNLKNELNNIILTTEKNLESNSYKRYTETLNIINKFADSLESIMEKITITQNNLNEYKTSVATSFKQTSEDFLFQFKNMQTIINQLDGQISTFQNEQVKYIRFEDGNIYIGVVGNEIMLKESNDRLSFLQNGIEVAFFSNNKLYINELEVLKRAKIVGLVSEIKNGQLTLNYESGVK